MSRHQRQCVAPYSWNHHLCFPLCFNMPVAPLITPPAAAGDGRAPSVHAEGVLRRHHFRRRTSSLRAFHHAASCNRPPWTATHGEGAPSRRAVHQKHLLCGTIRGTAHGDDTCPVLLRGDDADQVAQVQELPRADACLHLPRSRCVRVRVRAYRHLRVRVLAATRRTTAMSTNGRHAVVTGSMRRSLEASS